VKSNAATANTAAVVRMVQRKRGVARRKRIRNAVSMNPRTTNNMPTIAAKIIAGEASDIEVSCIIGASASAIPQKTEDSTTVRSGPVRNAPSSANTAVIRSEAYGTRSFRGGLDEAVCKAFILRAHCVENDLAARMWDRIGKHLVRFPRVVEM
jgi:hypothetical protein